MSIKAIHTDQRRGKHLCRSSPSCCCCQTNPGICCCLSPKEDIFNQLKKKKRHIYVCSLMKLFHPWIWTSGSPRLRPPGVCLESRIVHVQSVPNQSLWPSNQWTSSSVAVGRPYQSIHRSTPGCMRNSICLFHISGIPINLIWSSVNFLVTGMMCCL